MNLFAYGTLMSPGIWNQIIGKKYNRSRGWLYGYSPRKVMDEKYPGLLQKHRARTSGIIYFDVSSPDWDRLDLYEGSEYVHHLVDVKLLNGEVIPCITYLYKPELEFRLMEDRWSYKEYIEGGSLLYIN